MTNYLIIGNGVAGTTAAQEIRKHDSSGPVTIVTQETLPFYSRIKLPDFIAGITGEEGLVIRQTQWYSDHDITLKTGVTIMDINPDTHEAIDDTGTVYNYDRLLLATGSLSFIPPVDGSDLENVFALRTYTDAVDIVNAAAHAKTAVVIGGGLLGLEAAYALIKKGLKVIVIEFFDRLLPRQMDYEGAGLLKKMLEDLSFEFRLGAKTKAVFGANRVEGIELESGEKVQADLVLFSTGVRSNLDLPGKLDLSSNRGVIVNEYMETGLADIFAAGDVAQYENTNFCIWPEAMEQGRIAGINMAGSRTAFEPVVPSNRLKVAGIDLGSAGEIDPDNELDNDIETGERVYRKTVRKNGKVVGLIMLGDTSGFSGVVRQMAAG